MSVFGCSRLVILFACACAALAAPPEKQIFDLDDEAQLVQLFNDFKQEYKKNYHPLEHSKRFQIFVENLAEINAMNERDPTATYGIHEFADLTTEELVATQIGVLPDSSSPTPSRIVTATEVQDIEIPKQFDWRDHNVVTSVKDQGKCLSSYAFSAVGSIEGQYAMKYKELVDFSAQELVSCKATRGCNGGMVPSSAMYNAEIIGGLETEQDYPYTSGYGENGTCKLDSTKIKVTVPDHKMYWFPEMTEDEVAQVLVTTGPLSILVPAAVKLWPYKGGIISKENCKDPSCTVHAVLLVGYGEENDVPYWLVKDSRGTAMGEKGYFRMQRNVNCLKFMNALGSIPSIKKK